MAALGADDLARSASSGRSWRASTSFREVWLGPAADVFRQGGGGRREEEEEDLRWAAIERLPTYDRLRMGVLARVVDGGRVVREEVDVTKLGTLEKKVLMESILKVVEDDNEQFLLKLRNRFDRLTLSLSLSLSECARNEQTSRFEV